MFGVNEPTQRKTGRELIKTAKKMLIINSYKSISTFYLIFLYWLPHIKSTQRNKKNQLIIGQNENSTFNGYGGDYQKSTNQFTEEKSYSTQRYDSKIPLKLVMDPRGVVQDVHTQGITYDHSSGMLSPDKCAELVSALHTDAPKGKGSLNIFFLDLFFFSVFLIVLKIYLKPFRCWTLC